MEKKNFILMMMILTVIAAFGIWFTYFNSFKSSVAASEITLRGGEGLVGQPDKAMKVNPRQEAGLASGDLDGAGFSLARLQSTAPQIPRSSDVSAVSSPESAGVIKKQEAIRASEPKVSVANHLPVFVPVSSDTGPASSAPAAQLPAPAQSGSSQAVLSFIPQGNTIGPVIDKSKVTKPLPAFTPVNSKTGPVKPDSQ